MEMGMESQRSENSLLRAGDQDDRGPLPGTPEESPVQLAWPEHERTSCSTESQEGCAAVVASTVPVLTQIRTADVVSNWIHLVSKDGQKVYFDQVTGVSQFVKPDALARQEEELERMEEAAAFQNPAASSSAGGILEFIDITQTLNPHKFNRGAALPHTSSNRQLPYLSERSTPLSSTIVQWGPEGIFVCVFYKYTKDICMLFTGLNCCLCI